MVIDWLAVANGPPLADVARTLVLCGRHDQTRGGRLHARGAAARAWPGGTAEDAECDAWVRVLAGARLAEGFDGDDADWLRDRGRGARPA